MVLIASTYYRKSLGLQSEKGPKSRAILARTSAPGVVTDQGFKPANILPESSSGATPSGAGASHLFLEEMKDSSVNENLNESMLKAEAAFNTIQLKQYHT